MIETHGIESLAQLLANIDLNPATVVRKNKPILRELKKEAVKTKDIWLEEELDDVSTDYLDPRPAPEYVMHYRQKLGTEDTFLNLNGKTNSITMNSDEIVVEIHLPKAKKDLIELNIKEESLDVRSPYNRLFIPLPKKVKSNDGKAEWDGKSEKLIIQLPVNYQFDF
ncbi:PIH1-containing protein 3 domain-containing protein [Rozella allomycis CSF55]|uniref:PIH1-containing protein 3 domain-containing protein n=1 Tax=Rozella allomycis (strain CSF55) TaxID=988480 RepID=A0A075AVL4_ROZAC|nr:PIH1-containing protein 3 domain-containing protein [Rozella allomycis CSF55]|eukprot:EPZ32747.1 PIH1-containing protein 3 domain-containing protein [Rozella allomycis CSF55]